MFTETSLALGTPVHREGTETTSTGRWELFAGCSPALLWGCRFFLPGAAGFSSPLLLENWIALPVDF